MFKAITFDDVLIAPRYSSLESRKEADISTTIGQWRLSIPIISANMDTITGPKMANAMAALGGMGAMHRFCSIEQAVKDFIEAPKSFVSVGTKDYKERLFELYHAGARSVVVDIAHGHSENCAKVVRHIRETYPDVYIMAGNVATFDGYAFLIKAGADCVKVGIGPGSACSTRIATGCGVPQLAAIIDCARAQEEVGGALVADGGIRNPGDAAKSLAAGANAVMCGGIFAGCDETPGEPMKSIYQELLGGAQKPYKIYRGSASAESNKDNGTDEDWKTAEGVSVQVPCNGSISDVLKHFSGGIRSAMSYTGARTLAEFRSLAEFIEVSAHSVAESRPHKLNN